MMPAEIRTDRLKLRQLSSADLNVVHQLFSSPGHTIGDGPVADSAETFRWLQRREQIYLDAGLAFYGLWTDSGEMVGTCGIFAGDRTLGLAEIGYELDLKYRGRGYASEAAQAVIEATHAAGHSEVWATIRPWNESSTRVIKLLGFNLVRMDPDSKGPLDYYRHTLNTESS